MQQAQSTLKTAPSNSLFGVFRQISRSQAAKDLSHEGYIRWHTAIQHPLFNGVLVDRQPEGDEADLITETQAYFKSQGTSVFSWWVDEKIRFDSWAEALQRYNFKTSLDGLPGMAMVLADLPESVPTPQDFNIQIIQDKPGINTWAKVFTAGYGLPDSWAKPYGELLLEFGLDLDWRHYLGWLEGKPVATASLVISDGVAGIYNVAVLPEARRKGLGAAITLAALVEARQLGVDIGALQSSEMGFNVYQGLGFRQVCSIRNYYWAAE